MQFMKLQRPCDGSSLRWRNLSVGIVNYIMFRVAGTGGSPDKATLDEERKKNSENVWFTLKVFASYVAFLRLGKLGRDQNYC